MKADLFQGKLILSETGETGRNHEFINRWCMPEWTQPICTRAKQSQNVSSIRSIFKLISVIPPLWIPWFVFLVEGSFLNTLLEHCCVVFYIFLFAEFLRLMFFLIWELYCHVLYFFSICWLKALTNQLERFLSVQLGGRSFTTFVPQ